MKKLVTIGLIVSLSSIFLLAGCKTAEAVDGEYKELAQCLTEKGVKFYGSITCGHCKNQKEMFGDDFKYIDYVECHPNGENAEPEVCLEAKIEGYPTWEFPGQEQLLGLQQFETLAKKANCEDALNVKSEPVTENGE